MTKEDTYTQQAFEYVRKNHSPSEVSDFQAAMNIAVMKAFVAGAQWADKTIVDKACEWLIENHPTTDGGELYIFMKDFRKTMEE